MLGVIGVGTWWLSGECGLLLTVRGGVGEEWCSEEAEEPEGVWVASGCFEVPEVVWLLPGL